MEIPFLHDIVVIFGLSIVVLLLCHRIKIPTIVAFLFTGVLSGPYGLGLVQNVDVVDTFSKIGIVLLLFTIGLEFSLKKVLQYKRYFLFGGALQVLLTIGVGFLVAKSLGRPIGEAWFLGFLLSLSSTAIVFRLLEARSETTSAHGKFITGILIFQDVIVVLMMLLIPVLQEDVQVTKELLWPVVNGLALVVLVFVLATYVMPKLFFFITKTKSRELFLLSIIVICFSVAWLAESIGLTLSIGAFLAGLIVSETEHRQQALGDILPIQDIFTSFFFISIGMLLNIEFVIEQFALIVAVTILVMLLKAAIVLFSGLALRLPLRISCLSALSLCQVGEFSFVLIKAGLNAGIGTDFYYQLFLAVAIFSMGITPFMLGASHKIADFLLKIPFPAKIRSGLEPKEVEKKMHENHVIICGFGICGRSLAKALKAERIDYVVIEMNSETVKKEKKKGESILYGDASMEVVLNHANIKKADAVAVLVSDTKSAMRIVKNARRLHPNLYIISRARWVNELDDLYSQGANEVVPDEFGTSIEVMTKVLLENNIAIEEIEKIATHFRNLGYKNIADVV